MASSTTMPMARTNANSEMVLMETPVTSMAPRAPAPEMAIPRATQNASRISRNRASPTRTSSNPRETVLEQNREPFPIGFGIVVPDADPGAGRKRRNRLAVEELLDGPRHVQHLLVGSAVDLDERRRPSVVANDQIAAPEAVAHLGDVTQTYQRAVGAAEDRELLEVLLVVALPAGAYADLRVPGLDAPGREVDRTATHRLRHVLERQAQRLQPPARRLDRNLVAPHPARLDLRNRGQRADGVLGAVRQLLQGPLGDVPVEHQAHDALAIGHLPDLRTLGLRRERLDAIDRRLDVVERPTHVGTRLQLDQDGCNPLRRHRGDLPHPVETADLLLDLDDYGLLHLLRAGAGVAHRHLDDAERQLGKRFLDQSGQRQESGRDDEEHQKVGGDTVPRHVGDGAAPFLRGAILAVHRRPPIEGPHALSSITDFLSVLPAAPGNRGIVDFTRSPGARMTTRRRRSATGRRHGRLRPGRFRSGSSGTSPAARGSP